MPDVHLLLLEYGQEQEQAALALLVPVLHRAFPDAALRITIVDNALAGDTHATIDARVDRISGDNTLREFSGWDRGLQTGWTSRYRAASGCDRCPGQRHRRPGGQDRARPQPPCWPRRRGTRRRTGRVG